MLRSSLCAVLLVGVMSPCLPAAGPDVVAEGQLPKDVRLDPPKDLDGYFPFTPATNVDDWNRRADWLKRQVLVSQGIFPQPTKTPLNTVVHGKVDRGDYTVERVYFESMPGLFVTGSLYRPSMKKGKCPVVLCPHGHWNEGRFHDAGEASVRRQIVEGAERFEEGGRSPLQARCVTLARMGCIVFHYDMLGYADSVQLSFELVHRYGKPRPEMENETSWGLFSPQAESRLQSVMGLQTWNSIRALDFVESLSDADMSRVGVTGASGGGTQTFLLAAIDPRVTLSVPAVMVSTSMQGGCTCENASLLRVGTGNVELAAIFAPKPQLCLSADDWTREMPTKGFPELLAHYKLLGAEKNVAHKPLVHFPHNYNYVSRSAMYQFVNQHFKLGLPEPIIEADYKRLTREEMTVWDDAHPRPASGDDFERQLCRWWDEDSQEQLTALSGKPEYRAMLVDAWRILVDAPPAADGSSLPQASNLEYTQSVKEDRGDNLEMAGLLRDKQANTELPVAFLYPKDWKGNVVVWLSASGKAGMYQQDGKPQPAIAKLLAGGTAVMSADLLHQGEFGTVDQAPVVKNPRQFAGFTFGYNRTEFANRVHDVLTLVQYVRQHERAPKRVDVVALDGQAPVVVAARLISDGAIDRVAIDTHGFRFAKVTSYRSPQFVPGGAKYGDVIGALAASTPTNLYIGGETAETLKPVVAAYGEGKVTVAAEASPEAVADWLLR